MTTPDFPDLQDFPAWRGSVVGSSGSTSFPVGQTPSGITLVDSYGSIQVFMAPSQGPGTISVDFFQDAAGANPCGGYSWNLVKSYVLQVAIPILGPYCQVVVNNTSGGTMIALIFVTPANVGINAPVYMCTGNTILTGSAAYNAGQQITYPLPFIQGGAAHLHLDTAAAAQVFSISVATTTDGTTPLDTIFQIKPTGIGDSELTLPATPLLLVVHNTDTAAHNANAYLGTAP